MPVNLFNPSYLKILCSKYRLAPSSKYGQNFLIDPAPIEKMIEAAELTKDDTVVEVGPGFGTLTFALAEHAGKVAGFEIEKKLKEYWEKEIKRYGDKEVEIVWGNVLKIFTSVIARPEGPRQSPSIKGNPTEIAGDSHGRPPKADSLGMTRSYKLISNLPYQITSNAIRMFLEAERPPEVMVLMVQKEVAERICARAGEMSILSVSVQYYAEPEIIMTVPRTSFWPEPKVDSAIISIKGKVLSSKEREEAKYFFQIVKTGFANRRKMLFKNLLPLVKGDKSELRKIFAEVGLNEKARGQELAVGEWLRLAQEIKKKE